MQVAFGIISAIAPRTLNDLLHYLKLQSGDLAFAIPASPQDISWLLVGILSKVLLLAEPRFTYQTGRVLSRTEAKQEAFLLGAVQPQP